MKHDKPILIQYIEDRVHKKNKNFLMVIVGPTGSGKSYAALKLAELIDPTFSIDRCVFKARDFMTVINNLTDSKEDLKGKCLIWDELGVEHSAREFMTISNRVLNYFFQTCRHLNLVVLMTVPLLSFIDSNTRKLSHCIAETTGINMQKKQVTLKVKLNQTNVMTGKEYPKYLRYRKDRKQYVSKRIRVGMPAKEIREPYEIKKKGFTSELNKKIIVLLDKQQQKDAGSLQKPLTELQEQICNELLHNSVEQAAINLNAVPRTLYGHKAAIAKKGYKFRPIKEENRVIYYEIQGFEPKERK